MNDFERGLFIQKDRIHPGVGHGHTTVSIADTEEFIRWIDEFDKNKTFSPFEACLAWFSGRGYDNYNASMAAIWYHRLITESVN